jgi:hypothetical protein
MIGERAGWSRLSRERWESRRGEGSLLVVKPAAGTARTEHGTPYSWVFAWYGPAGGVIHGYSRTEFYNSAERAMDAAEAHMRRTLS